MQKDKKIYSQQLHTQYYIYLSSELKSETHPVISSNIDLTVAYNPI